MTHHPRHLTPARDRAAARLAREVFARLAAWADLIYCWVTRADLIERLERDAARAWAAEGVALARLRASEYRADGVTELNTRLARAITAARALADRWELEDRAGDRAPLSKVAAATAIAAALDADA